MKIDLISLYAEPDYSFKISHKVFNLIKTSLTEHLMKPYGLLEKDKNRRLSVFLSTNGSVEKVDVKGPDYDKRNDVINYAIWLPYEPIAKESDERVAFLPYYFNGLVILFEKYGVPEGSIREIQRAIEKEVLDNPEYVYEEEYLPPPDLSDLGL